MKKELRKSLPIAAFQSLLPAMLTIVLLSACTVTNNLYINDPVPLKKSDYELYGGIGMGLTPRIDSVSEIGEVFSHSLRTSYNLVMGGKVGVSNLVGLQLGIHLPEIVGGAGGTLRAQMSMFPNPAKSNLALVVDLGGVIAKDTFEIIGLDISTETKTRGAINADFSLPIGYQIGRNTRLIATPRYSFNTFYLRRSFTSDRSKRMKVQYPAFSFGLRAKKVQVEATVTKYKDSYSFMTGIVFFIGKNQLPQWEE